MKSFLLALVLGLFCNIAFAQMGANLVPIASATHTAIQDGSWQDATTWDNGVPTDGAKVVIPYGIDVTNHAVTADVLWIRILSGGHLTVCDHCNTKIAYNTIFVDMGGWLDLGEVGMPKTGKVILEHLPGSFLDGDWQKVSRGIICHGKFTSCGNEKTTWDIVYNNELVIGSTNLTLQNVPYGWQLGDKIAIAGTDAMVGESNAAATKYQTEIRTITAISGKIISWTEPLKYRHWRWRADLPFHCANTTRNITITSRDPSIIANRGHLMFMSPMINLNYIAVENCGRTDKSKAVTDPREDVYGVLIPGSDANPRARYAIHWHIVGEMGPPAMVKGCVVNGSPGWGFLIHKSNVQVDDCIATGCYGFGFGTEEGQERGCFKHCLSFLNIGLAETIRGSDDDHGGFVNADFGKDGAGFWLQGGLVDVVDCVSFDNSGRGFGLFNAPFNGYPDFGSGNPQPDYLKRAVSVNNSLLSSEYFSLDWYVKSYPVTPKPTAIPSLYVPQRIFLRNTAYNNKIAIQVWSFVANTNHTAEYITTTTRGSLKDTNIWGRGAMFHCEYGSRLNVENLNILGDSLFRSRYYASVSDSPPILVRGSHITVTGLKIDGKFNRNNWPNLYPISDIAVKGRGDEDPATHIFDGIYPIVDEKGNKIR